jgi:hypothetical protein
MFKNGMSSIGDLGRIFETTGTGMPGKAPQTKKNHLKKLGGGGSMLRLFKKTRLKITSVITRVHKSISKYQFVL